MTNVQPMSLPLTGPTFAAEEYDERLRRMRSEMRSRGLAAALVFAPENIYYLVGLNHLGYFAFTMLVVPLAGRPLLVTRAMERSTVTAQVPGCVHTPFADGEDPAQAAARAVREVTAAGDRVGVERTTMYLPLSVWEPTRAALDDLEFADASDLVDGLRAIKSPAEVEFVRGAAAISDRAMRAGVEATKPGVSERVAAAAACHEMLLAGSESPGFPPLIRSGDTLRQEHVTWRERPVEPGDSLFFELSASVARYHAPLTRMVYLGRPPAGTDTAAEIVIAAEQAVLGALRPGTTAGDVYESWQRVVDRGLGHSGYRRHHCGYMVGIGFAPSWIGGSAVVGLRRGSGLVIREGMVFHVLSWLLGQPPADYVISDTVLVTVDGGELLTNYPREPIVVS
jgi:Xaa-Pro dipeptidase